MHNQNAAVLAVVDQAVVIDLGRAVGSELEQGIKPGIPAIFGACSMGNLKVLPVPDAAGLHQRGLINSKYHASVFQGLLNIVEGDGSAPLWRDQTDLHGHLVGCDLHLDPGIAPLGHFHHKRHLRGVAIGSRGCDGVLLEHAVAVTRLLQQGVDHACINGRSPF